MRRLLTLAGLALVCTVLAIAETMTGQLLDANCYAQSKSAKACSASSSTSSFLLSASGKIYRLDEAGNAKAAEALKSRADRSTAPGESSGPVNAKVEGTMEGDVLHVTDIAVR